MKDWSKLFLEKATKLHNNKYDYSKVIYIKAQSKVVIICPLHGEFFLKPNAHLNGQGCPECAKMSMAIKQSYDNNTFIEKANTVHNNFYSYEHLNYKKSNEKVIITCPIHGDFLQTAREHLRGYGCLECSLNYKRGYRKTVWLNFCKRYNKKDIILYFVRLYNEEEEFIKIGITSGCVKDRFNFEISKLYKWEIVAESHLTPEDAFDKEKLLHKSLKEYKYTPKQYFAGITECFDIKLLNFIL